MFVTLLFCSPRVYIVIVGLSMLAWVVDTTILAFQVVVIRITYYFLK